MNKSITIARWHFWLVWGLAILCFVLWQVTISQRDAVQAATSDEPTFGPPSAQIVIDGGADVPPCEAINTANDGAIVVYRCEPENGAPYLVNSLGFMLAED